MKTRGLARTHTVAPPAIRDNRMIPYGLRGALGTLLLMGIASSAVAMPKLVGGAELGYRSADKLGLGVNISAERAHFINGERVPSMRAGIGMGGASLSAGASWYYGELPTTLTLHLAGTRTFDASDWPSGTWVGPESSLAIRLLESRVSLKGLLGWLQRIDGDHESRTEYGVAFEIGF